MTLGKQKRWILSLLIIVGTLMVLTTLTFRQPSWTTVIPQIRELQIGQPSQGSTGQTVGITENIAEITPSLVKIQDLDSLVLPRSSLDVDIHWRWNSTQNRVHPFNSVEHDKSSGADPYIEGFTIVMLSHHQRGVSVLPKQLEHLIGLKGLRKVVIIWNGESSTAGLELPKTPFPVNIASNGRNDLNHRFLPLDIIETDAILSLDDDVFAPHEKIMFGFRVWKEYRDRIVGFPGRGVTWTSKGWKYDYSACTFSLVLTGFAFIHKKYLSLYTYEMPAVIRERVANITNCEDIAMNFLVSHVTQQPPIRVANMEHYDCPDCGKMQADEKGLWRKPLHQENRSACINFFTEVYGYTPLFKAEYRFEDIFEGKDQCVRSNKNTCTKSYSPFVIFLAVSFVGLTSMYLLVSFSRMLLKQF